MEAITYQEYGTARVLRLGATDIRLPDERRVQIKVNAASVNPLDWHYMRGTPYLLRLESGIGKPKQPMLGADVAGVVTAVGSAVTKFKVGDAVFGTVADGSFAEFALASESDIALKPAAVSFEQVAATPIAALTALQALRDKGAIKPGQKVLINGASGGVGTFAVQLAKHFGAEVTAVCSTRNMELVRSLGADHVIDYTKDSYIAGAERYDLILDNVTNHALGDNIKVLKESGVYVGIGGGGPDAGNWIGPLGRPIRTLFVSPFVSQRMVTLFAETNTADLLFVAELMAQNKLRSVIDRRYTLSEVPAAIEYLETGRARGKVIISVVEEVARW